MPPILDRTSMPEQDPKVRAGNFNEVNLGYTLEMAQREASRCLNCKVPQCREGCPVQVLIPQFIHALTQGDLAKAYETITHTNNLPAICGRVCPQENQCEQLCILGRKHEPVAIGRLERFVADWAMQHNVHSNKPDHRNGKKVACVGSGPASLSCAADLAMMGYDVTIFEAFHRPGGVLVYGIPEFRLPKDLVAQELEGLREKGVRFETDVVVGHTVDVDELLQEEGYSAVFLGNGAGLPIFMNIPGETLNGVYSANEYLTRINLMKAYQPDSQTPIRRAKEVLVVGGGNVAMDAARSALRMGAHVTVLYRRSMEELPARAEEVHHAQEEGVEFSVLKSPVAILGDENGWVTGARCVRMELGQPDASGRRSPVEVEGSEFDLPADMVIMALGTRPNPLLTQSMPEINLNRAGCIEVDDDTMMTNLPGVFAGGDSVSGAATVILAMGAGKKAARGIDDYIKGLEA